MLRGIKQFGIELQVAGVRHMEGQLELSLAGAKRENEGVAVALGLRNGCGVHGLSTFGLGEAGIDLRALGEIELKILVVHLGARRLRSIVHGKQAHALKFIALCLKSQNIRRHAKLGHFLGYVEDLHVGGGGSRRRHMVISHALMNYSDKMRARVIQRQGKFALSIALDPCRFFHTLAKFDQDDVVPRGWLLGGSVGDRTRQAFGEGRTCKKGDGYRDAKRISQTRAPLVGRRDDSSRRAISARMPAASSSSPVLREL